MRVIDDLTGRIGLVPHDGKFMGKLVARVTSSPYCHVVVALDNHWCVSAEGKGAVRRLIKDFPGIVWIPTTADHEARKLIAWHAENLIGTRYNRLAFILAGLTALGAKLPSQLISLIAPLGMTCVMICAAAYKLAGLTLIAQPVTAWPGQLAGGPARGNESHRDLRVEDPQS